jgi:tRNA pseudouridine38-40 synthase
MPTFKLTVAYDGTGLVGWQRQARGTSIQGLLEESLGELDGRSVDVFGAGRTDAGVHALGQVASVTLERVIDGPAVVRAINARLPAAVRVLDAIEVDPAFRARFDARAKTYRYRIVNAEVMDPFERTRAWHVPAPRLDVERMETAAAAVEGRHDFAAFQTLGTPTRTTERTVFSSRVQDLPDLITYEICGDGFLRHMVRAIVGTLVEIGRGKRPPEWMAEVIASRSRAHAGPTAPPEGLFLVGVEYR